METTEKIALTVSTSGIINYAFYSNGITPVSEIAIQNQTDEEFSGITLRIWSEQQFVEMTEVKIEKISPRAEFSIKAPALKVDGSMLAPLTESVRDNLFFTLVNEDGMLCKCSKEIRVLAFDEWCGSAFFPEIIAAYVTPNHPAITSINAAAAELLKKWTGDPSLDAYQQRDPDRVKKMAAAVYGALQKENIVYSVPTASFEAVGQRIRLCDAVLSTRMGTCIDLSVLYASCLEAMGLHPIIVMLPTHTFVALWLEEKNFTEAVGYDASFLSKKLADGINEIVAVECTAMVSGKNISFDDAVAAATRTLQDPSSIEYFTDVFRARVSGIKPLPIRVEHNGKYEIVRDERSNRELTEKPTDVAARIDVTSADGPAQPVGKMAQWERKLLDLGLRNTLINMRLSRNLIPLLVAEADKLEDEVADGTDFLIAPKPEEIRMGDLTLESLGDVESIRPLLENEFKNKRLRSALSETELNKTVVSLYRAAKTALEENGANTLYIAIGMLRWYETPKSQKPRYAPLVMVPIDLVRKSAKAGYVLRLRNDDSQMNITLLQMLKQDFNIEIGGLDPLPTDEHGSDIKKVFTIVRHAVMEQPRWDVLEGAVIGNFSFSQFVMWNDLHNRADDLARNKIVKALIDGSLEQQGETLAVGERIDEDGTILPVPVDASQLNAIKAAAAGKSFVLHGPPGTGKSQTITALIANELAQGRKVLFVAEKMAALSVVQKRLEQLGIGPFCLQLHSNKSKKRDVLDQLRQSMEAAAMSRTESYASLAERYARQRGELDAYVEALHKQQNSGLSLYEMVDRYEAYQDSVREVSFDGGYINRLTPAMLTDNEEQLSRMTAAARELDPESQIRLQRVGCTAYSQSLKAEVPAAAAKYRQSVEQLSQSAEKVSAAAPVIRLKTRKELESFLAIADDYCKLASLPPKWVQYDAPEQQLGNIIAMCNAFLHSTAVRSQLDAVWKPEMFLQNIQQLKNGWNEACNSWALKKHFAQKNYLKTLQPYANVMLTAEMVAPQLDQIEQYHREYNHARQLLDGCYRDLGAYYTGANTDWAKTRSVAEQAVPLIGNVRNKGSEALCRSVTPDSASAVRELLDRRTGWEQNRQSLYQLLSISEPSDNEPYLPAESKLCEDLQASVNQLREKINWNAVKASAQQAGLTPMITACENGLSADELTDVYRKSIYKGLIIATIDKEAAFSRFNGIMFNEAISRFKETDKTVHELAKQEIYCRLLDTAGKALDHTNEVRILQKAIKSGGRGVSIRVLFEQIASILPLICPCMLMSPISAAQYLDPKREPFDIVVFDEASQISTCKAVGAIARGREAVIVGDPKQMPPTSFFTGSNTDEEEIEEEDLESILDDCLALGMSQAHLLWHYRSRHESLIAFSNSNFYENKLYTFPSVNEREKKVSLVHVDGTFKRGSSRTNEAEAAAIIEELIRRSKDKELSGQSVGIVTFNISQQNLIDDLLTEACKKDAALEAWAYNSEEPLFIKNLENVQGDERDVILFSIGYGPDENGKVYMNFGPLNREGGWRRLNVAVTRARKEMVVFSSVEADQIRTASTSSLGVHALRSFIEYAQGKPLSESSDNSVKSYEVSSVAKRICAYLEQNGYHTDTSIGHSRFRVDIGVVDNNNPDKYLLGIMLDGYTYRDAQCTRDREVAQISVLNGLGWSIYRMWLPDFWENRDKELKKLLLHLQAIELDLHKA